MSTDQATSPNTIVLIHGLWMTPRSWENWIERYAARGYRVLAPAWPGMDVGIDRLRADPSSVEHLGIGEIVDQYEAIVRDLDEPPIIMGHSFGGAFTEILLDRGLGAAGVAIDAAAIKGIARLPFAQLRSAFPVLKNAAGDHRAVMPTEDQFHFAFTTGMGSQESRRAFERYAVPGPGRVLFQAALANLDPHALTRVDFAKPDRAPLLLIGDEADDTVPADRSHFMFGQDGWEDVADSALDWAVAHLAPAAAASAEAR
jgi:pimeloyl-ACP methyl ester carboxylesterase